MTTKFLTTEELNSLKEEIKITELGTMIYNDGREQACRDNAKKLFKKNMDYEFVRDLIDVETLSDEILKKIYDEVMAAKAAISG